MQAAWGQDVRGKCPRLLFLGQRMQMTELTEHQIPHRDQMGNSCKGGKVLNIAF